MAADFHIPADRTAQNLGYARNEIRCFNSDILLAANYAPIEQRTGLLALYGFAAELARIPEQVSEPPLGLIRLQWWREALGEIFGTGAVRAHPIVELLAISFRGVVPDGFRQQLSAMIDAHEVLLSIDPFTDEKQTINFFQQTSGVRVLLAAEWLMPRTPIEEVLRDTLCECAVLAAMTDILLAAPEKYATGHGTRQVETAREKLAVFAQKSGPEAIIGMLERRAPKLAKLNNQPAELMPIIAPFALTKARLNQARKAMASGTYTKPAFVDFIRRGRMFRAVITGRIH